MNKNISIILSLAFACASCSQHTQTTNETQEVKSFKEFEEVKEVQKTQKNQVFKEKFNKIEVINQLEYPLDAVSLTDPLLLIKSMSQIDNQIKHCHYGKKKNSILSAQKKHLAQVFLKPSLFDFTKKELDLFVSKESKAQMLTFTQNQCFDKDNSYEDMKAKSEKYYGPVQDFVDNARNPKIFYRY